MAGEISKIAVLAPFAAGLGRRPGLVARLRHELTPALEVFGCECVLEVPRTLIADGRVAIPLIPADGLAPASWFPKLCNQHRLKDTSPAEACQEAQVAPQKPGSASPLDALLDMVSLPQESLQPVAAPEKTPQSPEAQLLAHILKHRDYRARCAAWEGLSWLHTLARGTIQWLLVDVDPTSCPEELQAVEDLLLEEEPELLLIDLPLTNTPRDQETLSVLAQMGDQLLAPVLSWLDSPFWGLKGWQYIDRLSYLTTFLDQPQYGKWHALCHRDEARLLSTSVGRFTLLRQEPPAPPLPVELPEPLWLAPVWALAALILSQQLASGLPYPLARTTIAPPEHTVFALEASFSEDRCLQFLQAHQAPLIVRSTGLSFAGLPLIDGSRLEVQLLIRSLLGWLFALDPSAHDAATLQSALLAQWQRAGLMPPAEIDFLLDQGHLFLSIRPLAAVSSGGGEITLQLPWGSTASPETVNGVDL